MAPRSSTITLTICMELLAYPSLFHGAASGWTLPRSSVARDRSTWATAIQELRPADAAAPFDAWLTKPDRVDY